MSILYSCAALMPNVIFLFSAEVWVTEHVPNQIRLCTPWYRMLRAWRPIGLSPGLEARRSGPLRWVARHRGLAAIPVSCAPTRVSGV